MHELIFQVTRDSVRAATEIGKQTVTVWKPEACPTMSHVKYGSLPCKVWMDKNSDLGYETFLHEVTPEEFEDMFGLEPPEPEESFWMRTDCNWEKVND